MQLLPANLKTLADVCSDTDGRYTLTGVHLQLKEDTFVAEATDTIIGLRVTGNYIAPANEFPSGNAPHFEDAPDGKTDALVGAAQWHETFTRGAKLTKGQRKAELAGVAVKVGATTATMAAVGKYGEATMRETLRLVEGRPAPIESVLNSCKDHELVFTVDPAKLVELLKAMLPLLDAESQQVRFYAKKDERTVKITASSPTMKVEGLIYGLIPPAPTEG